MKQFLRPIRTSEIKCTDFDAIAKYEFGGGPFSEAYRGRRCHLADLRRTIRDTRQYLLTIMTSEHIVYSQNIKKTDEYSLILT